MSNAMTAVERLANTLQMEKDLLLQGQAREVAQLAESKLEAISELEDVLAASPPETMSEAVRRSIADVVALANENSVHFEAVRNGLQNAASRLQSLGGGSLVGSYGQDGRQMSFTGSTGRYLKRV